MKKYPMKITRWDDSYERRIVSEKVSWDADNFKGSFRVWDLCDCPEDALVIRDLFSANDFIAAVRFGMDLAQLGYEGLDITDSVIEIKEEEE